MEAVTVRSILDEYLQEKTDHCANRSELCRRVRKLAAFWGNAAVNQINRATCREYARNRKASAARRELEDLRAALNLAVADGRLSHSIRVFLPPKPAARYQYLSRDQVAALVWTAYRRRKSYTYGGRSTAALRGKIVATKCRPSVHLARFILAAVYTGSRSSRIYRASFEREVGRPWIDLEAGLFYRTWTGEQTAKNKRAGTIRIPRRLLTHMRRWRRLGARYLVEFEGRPVDPKKAFSRLVRDVLSEGGAGICRHTLRHTAATWLMQSGININEIAGFLSVSVEVLMEVYAHHHPDHQRAVDAAFTRGHAGRQLPVERRLTTYHDNRVSVDSR